MEEQKCSCQEDALPEVLDSAKLRFSKSLFPGTFLFSILTNILHIDSKNSNNQRSTETLTRYYLLCFLLSWREMWKRDVSVMQTVLTGLMHRRWFCASGSQTFETKNFLDLLVNDTPLGLQSYTLHRVMGFSRGFSCSPACMAHSLGPTAMCNQYLFCSRAPRRGATEILLKALSKGRGRGKVSLRENAPKTWGNPKQVGMQKQAEWEHSRGHLKNRALPEFEAIRFHIANETKQRGSKPKSS